MAIIKAAHYDETEARLAKDPIIQAMAKGLADVPLSELIHDGPDGGPRFEFMQAANREYDERGGKDGGHIGAVANALLLALKEVKPTKIVSYYAGRSVPGAQGDENVAMTSVDIYSGDDFQKARDALIDYMVNTEAKSLAKYRSDDWAIKRMAAVFDAVQALMFAEFPGKESREVLSFDADKIRYQLVRSERPAK